MKIERFIVGPFQTNLYVVNDEHDVLIIDPACYTENEKQMVLNYVEPFQLSSFTFHLLATHGHLDHLWGAAWACAKWKQSCLCGAKNTPVLMHEADIPMAKAMQQQYDLFGIRAKPQPFPIEDIKSKIKNHKFEKIVPFKGKEIINHKFEIGNFQLLSTPGHTPGSICLYFPEDKVLFSGDTLFKMGYGRTDLPGGNYGQLLDSLDRLFALPSDVQVFPGHGEPTTIGAERRFIL